MSGGLDSVTSASNQGLWFRFGSVSTASREIPLCPLLELAALHGLSAYRAFTCVRADSYSEASAFMRSSYAGLRRLCVLCGRPATVSPKEVVSCKQSFEYLLYFSRREKPCFSRF